MGDRDKRSWVVRRAVYAVGFAAGLIVVALGRGTVADVEGWAPMIEQAATLAAALASGFAAIKTGPDSDNSRPVVPVDALADVAEKLAQPGPPGPPGPMGEPARVNMPELVDGVAARLHDLANSTDRPAAGPLAELRAAIDQNRRGG